MNASEHELIDCPAPESTYNEMAVDELGQGTHPHWGPVMPAAAVTLRTLEGIRFAGTLDG